MKQKKLTLMIGMSVVLFSTIFMMTACPNSSSTAKTNAGINVIPTATADPELKNTFWSEPTAPGQPIENAISFDGVGNIASINSIQALYTVNGTTISFDLIPWINIYKNMTLDKFKEDYIAILKIQISELQKDIDKETDPSLKQQLEDRLKNTQKDLTMIENNDPGMLQMLRGHIEFLKNMAKTLEPYAKFDGTFNEGKTTLTIEKFPKYDAATNSVTVKKIEMEKK